MGWVFALAHVRDWPLLTYLAIEITLQKKRWGAKEQWEKPDGYGKASAAPGRAEERARVRACREPVTQGW